MNLTFADTRTTPKATFGVNVSRHDDGTVSVVSNVGRGYRSAHRQAAATEFGTTYGKVRKINAFRYINTSGVLVVLTVWEA